MPQYRGQLRGCVVSCVGYVAMCVVLRRTAQSSMQGSSQPCASHSLGHYGPASRLCSRRDDRYGPGQGSVSSTFRSSTAPGRRGNLSENAHTALQRRRFLLPSQRQWSSEAETRMLHAKIRRRGNADSRHTHQCASNRKSSSPRCDVASLSHVGSLPLYRRHSDTAGVARTSNRVGTGADDFSSKGLDDRSTWSDYTHGHSRTVVESTSCNGYNDFNLRGRQEPQSSGSVRLQDTDVSVSRVEALSSRVVHVLPECKPSNFDGDVEEFEEDHGVSLNRSFRVGDSTRLAPTGDLEESFDVGLRTEDELTALCRNDANHGHSECLEIAGSRLGWGQGLAQMSIGANIDVRPLMLSQISSVLCSALSVAHAAARAAREALSTSAQSSHVAREAMNAATASEHALHHLKYDEDTVSELGRLCIFEDVRLGLKHLNSVIRMGSSRSVVTCCSEMFTPEYNGGRMIHSETHDFAMSTSTTRLTQGIRVRADTHEHWVVAEDPSLWVMLLRDNRRICEHVSSRVSNHLDVAHHPGCDFPDSESVSCLQGSLSESHLQVWSAVHDHVSTQRLSLNASWDSSLQAYKRLRLSQLALCHGKRDELTTVRTDQVTTYSADTAEVACARTPGSNGRNELYSGHRAPRLSATQLGMLSAPERSVRALRHFARSAELVNGEESYVSEVLASSANEARIQSGAVLHLPTCSPLQDVARTMLVSRKRSRDIDALDLRVGRRSNNVLEVNAHVSNRDELCVEDALATEISFARTNNWTDVEKIIFLDKFVQYPKNFSRISSFLRRKRTRDCVRLYYDSKHDINYKALLREHQQRRRGRVGCWGETKRAVCLFGGDLVYDAERNIVWFKLPVTDHTCSGTVQCRPFSSSSWHASSLLAGSTGCLADGTCVQDVENVQNEAHATAIQNQAHATATTDDLQSLG